jgi:hypothetical protein|tara:strand:- start:2082 stop:2504 length:423 start_codon:yes stop_codon:yes gene_type:complete
MKELWGSGIVGRITMNVIWAISFLVAAYLLYVAYKKVLNLIATGKVKKVTVKYAELFDVNPPYAKGEIQFGFKLPEKMEVKFRIVNRDDDLIKELKKGELEEGVYPILFDTNSIADGEYYYQIITDVQKTSKKFFVVNKL